MIGVSTAREYNLRLNSFKAIVEKTYNISIDTLIEQIMQGSEDVYDILSQ